MSTEDVEFARRSVQYLRSQGLGPMEIRSALRWELQLPAPVADRLAAAA